MTVVRVKPGTCGFFARITAMKEGRRSVSIRIESDCEAVAELGAMLEDLGPLGIKEIMTRGIPGNPVFAAGAEILSHSACPVAVAVIKAAEVELGLNVPGRVTIEFEPDPGEP